VPPYDHHQNAVEIPKTKNPSSKIFGLIIPLQCPKDLLKPSSCSNHLIGVANNHKKIKNKKKKKKKRKTQKTTFSKANLIIT
jgi:hypothetical protein